LSDVVYGTFPLFFAASAAGVVRQNGNERRQTRPPVSVGDGGVATSLNGALM